MGSAKWKKNLGYLCEEHHVEVDVVIFYLISENHGDESENEIGGRG